MTNFYSPICQSCAMPLKSPEDYGTNADDSKNPDYCHFCFQNGQFTSQMTKEEFIEKQTKMAIEKFGMDEKKARELALTIIPKLKRWQT